jgi:hypothetical protein
MAGPLLASIAVVISIIVFKRTVDYQAYKEVDSEYMEVLKIDLDHPNFRDPDWTTSYQLYISFAFQPLIVRASIGTLKKDHMHP